MSISWRTMKIVFSQNSLTLKFIFILFRCTVLSEGCTIFKSENVKIFSYKNKTGWHLWLMPVILATWETEIWKITVWGQPGQILNKTPSPKWPEQNRLEAQVVECVCFAGWKPWVQIPYHKKKTFLWALHQVPSAGSETTQLQPDLALPAGHTLWGWSTVMAPFQSQSPQGRQHLLSQAF
jgi:hypothetical protein